MLEIGITETGKVVIGAVVLVAFTIVLVWAFHDGQASGKKKARMEYWGKPMPFPATLKIGTIYTLIGEPLEATFKAAIIVKGYANINIRQLAPEMLHFVYFTEKTKIESLRVGDSFVITEDYDIIKVQSLQTPAEKAEN